MIDYDELSDFVDKQIKRSKEAEACSYWADNVHLFTAEDQDSEGGYVTPREKTCLCGATVKRR